MQQSGQGGWNREVSESIIIVRVQNSHDWRGLRRREILSAYLVEEVDEEAMTAFIKAMKADRRLDCGYRYTKDKHQH